MTKRLTTTGRERVAFNTRKPPYGCPSPRRRGARSGHGRPRRAARAGRPLARAQRSCPGCFSTMALPLTSTIVPRRPSTRAVRTWLSWAAARYSSPETTCNAQRRKNKTANSTTAKPPKIAMRNPSLRVSRKGASTRGSPGRKGPSLRSGDHLSRGRLGHREDLPDEQEQRVRGHEVEHKRWQQNARHA